MLPLRALRPFVRRGDARRESHARCELCRAAVGQRHAHVVELSRRTILCACGACAVLFRDPGAGGGRYRTVAERVVAAAHARVPEAEWARLEIPVRLAIVVRRDRWTALYPSPAGPVEAELSDAAIAALHALAPAAASAEADIEAIVLHRTREGDTRIFVVPLDAAFELVAIVRQKWRGFDGGDEVRATVDAYLAHLEAAAERGAP